LSHALATSRSRVAQVRAKERNQATIDAKIRIPALVGRCPPRPSRSLSCAGLIHAVWNIIAKKAGGDARFATFTSVLMALIWAPLGIWLGWSVVPTWGTMEWAFVVVSGLLMCSITSRCYVVTAKLT
jgi:hypothetical protein